jgi:L-alanine-DL-glutamate epimerase-like enolase superfamily enzyme
VKIVDVSVVPIAVPAYAPAFKWRSGLPGSEPATEGGWLVIRTDDDITGYAFCPRGVILADLVERRLRADLLGVDPLAREFHWERMWELDRIERFPVYITGVVDVALWDLAAKAADVPLYKLLGYHRDSIPAYASTVTFSTVEEFLDVADQCLELGYPAIKLHAWGDARADARLCTALREHVGDDIPLMYDGSAGFDLMDATYLGHALADSGYLWYEEPMREFIVEAYRRLAERVAVPLLVSEVTEGAHMSTANFIAAGCASAVRTGSTLRGGVTGALRTAHLAEAFLLRAEVHAPGLVNLHLCMSIRNNTYYESIIDSNPVRRPDEVDSHGMVHAPLGVGVGFEQEWAVGGAPFELESRRAG